MEQFLLRAGHAGVVLLEVLALVWAGKKAAELVTRRDFDRELLARDNPAAGLTLAGFYAALFVALSGLLAGEPRGLGQDVLLTALYGAGAIAGLLLSAALWRPVLEIDFRQDILEARNAGAGLVAAAALVATGLVYRGALSGQGDAPASVIAFFAIGEGALLLAFLLYEWITPYDVYAEVGGRANLAAAAGASGALLAAGLIAGNAVEGAFTSWIESIRDTLVYLVPLAALPLVRWLVVDGLLLSFRNVNREVTEDRNAAAGFVEGAAYVGTALFVLHLL
jgi:uncharacterized membrane protein YjfL (UPF0719 family)